MERDHPLLQVRQLEIPGLAPISLELAAGECLVIQGPSGSGKTRLLRALADLDPAAGELWLNGHARRAINGPDWRRQMIYVPADSGWWAERVGAHFDDWAAVHELLPELGLPPECCDWHVERLSTGERQRLALLRALILHPRVLLLDEPTAGLDARATAAVERLIARFRDAGLAVLWVTHDDAQAERVASARHAITDGRLAAA